MPPVIFIHYVRKFLFYAKFTGIKRTLDIQLKQVQMEIIVTTILSLLVGMICLCVILRGEEKE